MAREGVRRFNVHIASKGVRLITAAASAVQVLKETQHPFDAAQAAITTLMYSVPCRRTAWTVMVSAGSFMHAGSAVAEPGVP